MSSYRPNLPEPDELRNPRWLCGRGRTVPLAESPAYPICECGLRMHFVEVDGLGYVGARESEG